MLTLFPPMKPLQLLSVVALLATTDSAILPNPTAGANPTKASAPMTSIAPVSPQEAEALLKSNPQILIIDVRTQEEFAEGHIPGAQNVNFNSPIFLERMKAFEGKTILLHCASGGRSGRALTLLSTLPLQKIYHLHKGFNGWQEAGKTISKN